MEPCTDVKSCSMRGLQLILLPGQFSLSFQPVQCGEYLTRPSYCRDLECSWCPYSSCVSAFFLWLMLSTLSSKTHFDIGQCFVPIHMQTTWSADFFKLDICWALIFCDCRTVDLSCSFHPVFDTQHKYCCFQSIIDVCSSLCQNTQFSQSHWKFSRTFNFLRESSCPKNKGASLCLHSGQNPVFTRFLMQ